MTAEQFTTCLSERSLRRMAMADLTPEELSEVESHLGHCDACRRLLEENSFDDCWNETIRPAFLKQLNDDTIDSSPGPDPHMILELLGATDHPQMLGRIDKYEIAGIIGQGGMGIVFKAFDWSLNRYVAIKLLLPHLATSGASRQRFERETRAAAAVIHDHVLPIHTVAHWRGIPYLVTQYSSGPNLQQRLEANGPMESKDILRIAMQITRGLAAAHAQGLVHRDIKPSNILLDGTVSRAMLTDFGLARTVDDASITRTGTIAGTPQYMSPEQVRGDAIDARSDLFSLGATMYAMCTGRSPFRANSTYAVLHRLIHDEPRNIRELNPEIPEWLCTVVDRLMCKEAAQRFQSAAEVAELLEQCLAHLQQPTRTPLPAVIRKMTRPSLKSALNRNSMPGSRRPDTRWISSVILRVAGTVFGLSALAFGIVILLELNKGVLRIESTADDVPIRISKGNTVVERLTVTRNGTSLRVASGEYLVEFDGAGEFGLEIQNGAVQLQRGGLAIVSVAQTSDSNGSVPTATSLSTQQTDTAGTASDLVVRAYGVGNRISEPQFQGLTRFHLAPPDSGSVKDAITSEADGLIRSIEQNCGVSKSIQFDPLQMQLVIQDTPERHELIRNYLMHLNPEESEPIHLRLVIASTEFVTNEHDNQFRLWCQSKVRLTRDEVEQLREWQSQAFTETGIRLSLIPGKPEPVQFGRIPIIATARRLRVAEHGTHGIQLRLDLEYNMQWQTESITFPTDVAGAGYILNAFDSDEHFWLIIPEDAVEHASAS